jgi:hypothetical protein
MSDIVPMIHPHQLAKIKARFKLHYPDYVQMLADCAEWERGRCDLEFVLECNKRAICTLVEIYDMSCLDEWERKRLRQSFRRIVARQGGRLAPYYNELHRTMRSRLKEHDLMVRCGLDPPDEPRSNAQC